MKSLVLTILLGALGGSFCLAQNYRCDWSVSGIGGAEMSSTAYRCGATAGQTAAGQMTGTLYLAFIGFWQADFQVGVSEESPMPQVIRPTLAAAPNPFGSRVNIRYSLADAGPALLSVHDVTGRVVREFAASGVKPGAYGVSWDGTDAQGRRLAEGVYFCRLVVPGLGHDPGSDDGIGSCPAPLTLKLVLQR